MAPNEYAYAAGASTSRSGRHSSYPRGGGVAAWAKTEALASFWTIDDVTAPGIPSTHQLSTHQAPVDVGVVFMAIKLT